MDDAPASDDWVAVTSARLEYGRALEWASGPGWGGVVGFLGVVRDHSEGRSGVTSIEYEAYEEQVVARMSRVTADARAKWQELGRLLVWHRLGRVALGEPSVVTVASAVHRGRAFDACEFLIDALKQSVPIWKREFWPGGSDWSPAARHIGSAERVEEDQG